MNTDMNRHLGRAIARRRHALRLTLDDLAQAVGVTYQTVFKYEQGVISLSAVRAWQLANVLEMPVAALAGLDDQKDMH